ncbi:MAG: alanine dehydrogenase [Bacillota bacterium]|nr:alanine dehydrogenase [Bacillota bacterium]
MLIGVPKEIKADEQRVALTPAGARELVKDGHKVLVQSAAGAGCGMGDEDYAAAGAAIVPGAADAFVADLVLKVKEPLAAEYEFLRSGQVLFTYLHLAASRTLTEALMESGAVAIAYETIESSGSLPLLTPMSEVAGRMSVQIGAQLLERRHGGKGVLLGGVPGVSPAQVVVVGAGVVGSNAARVACGMGASVAVFDVSASRLRWIDDVFGGRVLTQVANSYSLERAIRNADLLIGAVLVPGARAPRPVTDKMVAGMEAGSAIVDVAIDQGGCIETIDRTTTHSQPTYLKHGVVHYSVPNIPAAVPRTSTVALTNATLPYVLHIAREGWQKAVRGDPGLASGVNVVSGSITCGAVAEAFGLPSVALELVV